MQPAMDDGPRTWTLFVPIDNTKSAAVLSMRVGQGASVVLRGAGDTTVCMYMREGEPTEEQVFPFPLTALELVPDLHGLRLVTLVDNELGGWDFQTLKEWP